MKKEKPIFDPHAPRGPKSKSSKNRAMVKHKRLIVLKAVKEGKSYQEAGEIAGFKKDNAKQQAFKVMARPDMQIMFRGFLEEVVPDQRLANKYGDLLESTKIISAVVINNKTNPTSQADGELPPADSMTKDFIEVPDYPTQLKAADSISKLKGHMVEGNQNNVQINFESLTDKQLEDIIAGKPLKQ